MASKPAKKPAGATRRRRKAAPKPAPEPELWERQEGEGAGAFEAFATYRDQGPDRSIRAAGRQLGKNRVTLEQWSSKWRWVSRAAAWDQHLDDVARRELEQEQVDARRRHSDVLRGQIEALAAPAQELLERLKKNPKLLEKLTLTELASLAVQGARATPRLVVADRLVLGVSTENLGAHDGGAFTPEQEKVRRMPDAEIDSYLLGRRDQAALDRATADADRAIGE